MNATWHSSCLMRYNAMTTKPDWINSLTTSSAASQSCFSRVCALHAALESRTTRNPTGFCDNSYNVNSTPSNNQVVFIHNLEWCNDGILAVGRQAISGYAVWWCARAGISFQIAKSQNFRDVCLLTLYRQKLYCVLTLTNRDSRDD